MIQSLQQKKLNELDAIELLRELKKADASHYVSQERMGHVERALELPLPGAPDEAWRRVPLDDLKFDERPIVAPLLETQLDGKIVGTGGGNGAGLPAGLSVARVPGELNGPTYDAFKAFRERYSLLYEQRRRKNKGRANDVRENKFLSFAEALAGDSLFIRSAPDTRHETPLHLSVHNTTAGSVGPAVVCIHVCENSRLSVVVDYQGTESDTVTIPVIKAVVAKGGELRILRTEKISDDSHLFSHEFVLIEEDGKLNSDAVFFGSKATVLEGLYSLMGRNARANVRGLVSVRGKQFSGQKLTMEHNAEHTYSDTVVKTVLYDAAHSVFAGTIKIPAGSRHSEGYETNRNLLLGDDTHADSIPQLEIIENEVKCSHGATMTSTVPEEVYYLMSRGLPEAVAERILVGAFYREILDQMELVNEDAATRTFVATALREETGLELDPSAMI
ncbi:MAG: SufD family Fe-S cluster assembly protein [Spirochaeta sp.]|nr:SufD family Fe-S cluster assembly protein [Spirochaeta sp.]